MARLGRTVRLQCPVEGDPPPLTMWAKDGRTIHGGWSRFRVLPQGLKVKAVEAGDAGVYVCKATNGFGSLSLNYTLVVAGQWGWGAVGVPQGGSGFQFRGAAGSKWPGHREWQVWGPGARLAWVMARARLSRAGSAFLIVPPRHPGLVWVRLGTWLGGGGDAAAPSGPGKGPVTGGM